MVKTTIYCCRTLRRCRGEQPAGWSYAASQRQLTYPTHVSGTCTKNFVVKIDIFTLSHNLH